MINHMRHMTSLRTLMASHDSDCCTGACGACLTKAGVMHDHKAGSSDPSPLLSGSLAAPLEYCNPPPCKPL